LKNKVTYTTDYRDLRSKTIVDNSKRQDVLPNTNITKVAEPILIENQIRNSYIEPQRASILSSSQVPFNFNEIKIMVPQQHGETLIGNSKVISQSFVPVGASGVIRPEGIVNSTQPISTLGSVSTHPVIRTERFSHQLSKNSELVYHNKPVRLSEGSVNQVNQEVAYQNYGLGENVVKSEGIANTGLKVVRKVYLPKKNYGTTQANHLNNMPVINTNMVNQEVVVN